MAWDERSAVAAGRWRERDDPFSRYTIEAAALVSAASWVVRLGACAHVFAPP